MDSSKYKQKLRDLRENNVCFENSSFFHQNIQDQSNIFDSLKDFKHIVKNSYYYSKFDSLYLSKFLYAHRNTVYTG